MAIEGWSFDSGGWGHHLVMILHKEDTSIIIAEDRPVL